MLTVLAVAALATSACGAGAGGRDGGQPHLYAHSSHPGVLEVTPAAIASSRARNAWEALRLLGPAFSSAIRSNGFGHRGTRGVPLVVLDGIRLAHPVESALRTVPADVITSLEFYSSALAGARFGNDAAAGAVVIRTRA